MLTSVNFFCVVIFMLWTFHCYLCPLCICTFLIPEIMPVSINLPLEWPDLPTFCVGSRPACASMQSDQDPCCSLSVSLLATGFVSKQHGSWSDCVAVQAGLDPCWSKTHILVLSWHSSYIIRILYLYAYIDRVRIFAIWRIL
jgi:hypothetical protein